MGGNFISSCSIDETDIEIMHTVLVSHFKKKLKICGDMQKRDTKLIQVLEKMPYSESLSSICLVYQKKVEK